MGQWLHGLDLPRNTELAPFSPQTTHKPPVLNKIAWCLSEAMQIECIKPQDSPQVLKTSITLLDI